jgi:hypothetical protein
MRFPFDDYQPVRPAPAVLNEIRRRARRRVMVRAAALSLAALALGVAALLRVQKPAPVFTPPSLVVQKVWSGSKDVPYMIYQSESGHPIIFISSSKEDAL